MTTITNHSNDCHKTSSVMYFFSRHDAFYQYAINVSCISKFLNCCPPAEFSKTEYLPRCCSESFHWQVWLDWNHGNILTCNSMTDWNLNASSVQSYSDIFCHYTYGLIAHRAAIKDLMMKFNRSITCQVLIRLRYCLPAVSQRLSQD